MKTVRVRARGSLADFMGPIKEPDFSRSEIRTFSFTSRQLAKDAIEGVGIPHPEVDLLLADGASARFDLDLKDGMVLEVFPYGHPLSLEHTSHVRIPEHNEPIFLVDENLGRLATYLTLLGFDSVFVSGLGDAEIAERAASESRILLSRDVGILKRTIVERGLWVRSDDPSVQILQVVKRYELWPKIKPFTRCPKCRSPLEAISVAEARAHVPPAALEAFQEFFRCSGCGHHFWKGSHFDRMSEWLETIRREVLRSILAQTVSCV